MMKADSKTFVLPAIARSCAVLVCLLLVSACSSHSHHRGHGYQPTASPYPPNHSYSYRGYSGPAYYATYYPGWSLGAYYPGSYYSNAWPYGPMVYWPTYNYYYHSSWNYPYYDPWYYSRSAYFGRPYGYGRYGYWPQYGGSHSYRPPSSRNDPLANRPPAVVIPPGQRGRRGASGDYSDDVARGVGERDSRQPERRSSTVVTERQGMSRSVVVAPSGANGDQGMVISNRADRKVSRSRLEPVVLPAPVTAETSVSAQSTGTAVPISSKNSKQRWSTGRTVPSPVTAEPSNTIGSSRSQWSRAPNGAVAGQSNTRNRQAPQAPAMPSYNQAPQAPAMPSYNQAPARIEPAQNQRPAPQPQRNEPSYQYRTDSGREESRNSRGRDRGGDREREHD
jgi:hypothetical protein